ncbi:hypothetical protein MBAV_001213 [Candidatus Magnetobacterium bavaricum]|uniref:DUF4276 family protein n=1 Tax=Candidatus Magnetobacterium bavaricum TaxID=29290 RepID=A0A0F3GXK8_9BACT|nr:hypothetical protein MBAV_001213 [Candidatus Magnetobacterium bavaricum]
MREKSILQKIEVFNGKYDMQDTMKFTVRQHLSPPKKIVSKSGNKPLGDYVFILRDLDCEDKKEIEYTIDNELSDYKGCYSVHFAVQEIEAWMIADQNCFKSFYKNKSAQIISAIKKIPHSSTPEEIDCEPKKISELLEEIAYKYNSDYKKTKQGTQLLDLVNPDVVASKCPSFADFRNDLRAHIGLPSIIL